MVRARLVEGTWHLLPLALKEALPEMQGRRQPLPESKATRDRGGGDFLPGQGEGDGDAKGSNQLSESLPPSLFFRCHPSQQETSSKHPEHPRLPPLLRLLPPRLSRPKGCGVSPQARALGHRGLEAGPSQVSALLGWEESARRKVRGPGVGDSAGHCRPKSCCFVLC